jgi:site-specific recombinase XerD
MRLLDPDLTLDPASLAAWRDFRRDLAGAGCSPHTARGYGDALAQLALAEGVGGNIVGATRDQVAAYLAGVSAAHAHGTLATRFRRLHRWFGWLLDEELIGANPMDRIKRPVGEEKAPAILSGAQLRALLDACRAPKGATAAERHDALRDTAMIMVLCEPGCPRASELTSMTVEGTDLAGRDEITIAGKGRMQRAVPMDAVTARAISRYLRARALHPKAAAVRAEAQRAAARREPPGEPLWLGKRGPMTRSGLQQMLDRRTAAAGIGHVHPHQLRHTAYDRADAAGLSAWEQARLNGWKSTRMCDVYGRAASARRAVEAGRGLGLVSSL